MHCNLGNYSLCQKKHTFNFESLPRGRRGKSDTVATGTRHEAARTKTSDFPLLPLGKLFCGQPGGGGPKIHIFDYVNSLRGATKKTELCLK